MPDLRQAGGRGLKAVLFRALPRRRPEPLAVRLLRRSGPAGSRRGRGISQLSQRFDSSTAHRAAPGVANGEAGWTWLPSLTINRRSRASWPGSAQVAQLVEHATENRSVGGSIPPLGTITPPPMTIYPSSVGGSIPNSHQMMRYGAPRARTKSVRCQRGDAPGPTTLTGHVRRDAEISVVRFLCRCRTKLSSCASTPCERCESACFSSPPVSGQASSSLLTSANLGAVLGPWKQQYRNQSDSSISSPNRAATSLSSSSFAAPGSALVSAKSCPAWASNSFSSTPRSTKSSSGFSSSRAPMP